MNIFMKLLFAIFSILFSCGVFAQTACSKVHLDSVGDVSITADRLLEIARTARGPNYAAYVLISPTAKERERNISKILIMSNAADHEGVQCRPIKSADGQDATSCVSVLSDRSMLLIATIEKSGDVSNLGDVIKDAVMDIDENVLRCNNSRAQ